MKLLLDLGNSRCKWALADHGLHPGGAFEYGPAFSDTLALAFGKLARPERVVAASVAGAARTGQLAAWVQAYWGVALECVVAQPSQLGVTNRYVEPARLGADRWAALIAARARAPGPVCVVDCGTAVTVDALDAHGVFRGGVILPGLALQRSSLLQGTHGVHADAGRADDCLARTTTDAVAAGIFFGMAGAIDRILDEQAAALGAAPTVLLTGGDAPRLRLRHAGVHAPDLVLEGVARLAETL
jgi:type III pantothenate kinase